MGHVAYLCECGGGGSQTSDGAALWNVMSVTAEGMRADCWDQVFIAIVSISRRMRPSPTALALRGASPRRWHQATTDWACTLAKPMVAMLGLGRSGVRTETKPHYGEAMLGIYNV
jgi:hypothetical protein